MSLNASTLADALSLERAEANRRLLRKGLIAAFAAFSFCFAMIPIYSIWCEITGANGKTGRMNPSAVLPAVDRTRTVRVEFMAAVNSGLAWHFKPEVTHMMVHPGVVATAYFDAENTSAQSIIGNAVPSVAPNKASIYFNKTECFCFTEQQLAPGESRRMPVKFVIDSALPSEITALTLAYTFYRNDLATNRLANSASIADNSVIPQ